MKDHTIIQVNRQYWNDHADKWFGTSALPVYGVNCVTEEDLHLFGDVRGKKLLEICCGSGHSLKYQADHGAGELWGVDLSEKQLENAQRYLAENGRKARLVCGAMEEDLGLPQEYFDYVYSIYGMGWTTDLDGTLTYSPGAYSFSAGTTPWPTAWAGRRRGATAGRGRKCPLPAATLTKSLSPCRWTAAGWCCATGRYPPM